LICLLTTTLFTISANAASFDFPEVRAAEIKGNSGAFDAPKVTEVHGAFDGLTWSDADLGSSGTMFVRDPKSAQGYAPRTRGSLAGSTFRWERDQRAAWGGGIPGLTTNEAQGGCGPIAAEALVRFLAGAANLDRIREIFNLAKNKGYWNGAMKGPASEQALLRDLGIQVGDPVWVTSLSPGERMIRESLDRGKPVIISTNRHYFFAEGYNNNGQLFVGYTGEVMRGGYAQMTLSDISRLGNGGLALLILK
jgi:hypothetical protein